MLTTVEDWLRSCFEGSVAPGRAMLPPMARNPAGGRKCEHKQMSICTIKALTRRNTLELGYYPRILQLSFSLRHGVNQTSAKDDFRKSRALLPALAAPRVQVRFFEGISRQTSLISKRFQQVESPLPAWATNR
ncbi:hypothetical protein CISG_09621 [Coccidioides immitis RMSCC 3703]|uniref:Uncharacterized protein n=2 Tax=Coccidioides immitis TaxID=5501 RepID=A0A0J8RBA3_COCIT|nr:hypothetical protein CIRG_02603 [Coccidioides immitis RMSCC 2394]KMU82091.1 hypothetical protein CISG_09621 [Coccidioides immitis RMSCC 3703]